MDKKIIKNPQFTKHTFEDLKKSVVSTKNSMASAIKKSKTVSYADKAESNKNPTDDKHAKDPKLNDYKEVKVQEIDDNDNLNLGNDLNELRFSNDSRGNQDVIDQQFQQFKVSASAGAGSTHFVICLDESCFGVAAEL